MWLVAASCSSFSLLLGGGVGGGGGLITSLLKTKPPVGGGGGGGGSHTPDCIAVSGLTSRQCIVTVIIIYLTTNSAVFPVVAL